MNLSFIRTINKEFSLKMIVLFGIILLYLGRSLNDFEKPYLYGDGLEYVLMTEAFHNHFSPNILSSDVESYTQKFAKHHDLNDFSKKGLLTDLSVFTKRNDIKCKDNAHGFYANKNGKLYSIHFFFYSLINLPVYSLLAEKKGPVRTFYITNALMVILTCLVLLFYTPFSTFNSILASLCFCFSAAYWSLPWQHTEIYTMCLVAVGLVLFFKEKYYWSLFLIALACLQNQPLILLLGFLAVITFIKKEFVIKNMLIVTGLLSIALIPPLFYYINFDTTNLVKDTGFLDSKYVTTNRVLGFYFDFDQGMILTIPFILITYIILVAANAIKMIRKKIAFDYFIFIPFVLLAITFSVATMGYWNHACAVINRYATWTSVVIMIHSFYLVNNLRRSQATILFNYFFVTQCFTTLYHQQYNVFDWSLYHHTDLAKWAFAHHPKLYNPDPTIFIWRTAPNTLMEEQNSPFIYFDKKSPRKILVHKNRIDELGALGVSKENIEKMKEKIKYNFDWGYIDMQYFKTDLGDEGIYNFIRNRKLEAAKNKILGNLGWVEQIRQKAAAWGKTFEEVVAMDAEYVVTEDEKAAGIK